MAIDATIQARHGSHRLPGKVIRPILGKPMMELQIERIRQSRLIDRVIIATTDKPQDDPIADLAVKLGCPCFRGSEEDVLGRVVGALEIYQVDIHVEFQGDNPIPDPLLVDSIIGYYLKNEAIFDYVTNGLKTTYPPGLEVSVYPAQVLIDAEARAGGSVLREHVGLHIYQSPERYRIQNLEAPRWLARPDFHFEVDTEEDFDLITAVFEHFYETNPGFSLSQVIEFAEQRPDLTERNRGVERRWRKLRPYDQLPPR